MDQVEVGGDKENSNEEGTSYLLPEEGEMLMTKRVLRTIEIT